MDKDNEVAECRNCGKKLIGKPYYMGGKAIIPESGEFAKSNHYGGFVCSKKCDEETCFKVESYPDKCFRLSPYAIESLKKNWE